MSESGRILLEGDVIRYRSAVYRDWDLSVSDVRIIGEVTNQNGPFADDYFFCFASGPAMWREASFYAEGRDEFLSALGAKLGSPLEVGLCHSTDFASRVLWPPSLVGEPMFRFDDIPAKGLWGKLFGSSQNRQTYSERVAAVLASDR
jgi:hypothetical protein